MKIAALFLFCAMLTQVFPSKIYAGPTPVGGAFGALSVLGIFGGSTTTSDKESKSEFSKLNSCAANLDLMKQSAGGSLNTLEILK